MHWFEIAVPVPSSAVDEAAALLDWAGFGGVEVREAGAAGLPASAEPASEPAETGAGRASSRGSDGDETTDVVVVVESVDVAADVARAMEAVAVLGPGTPRVVELDPRIWTENWKSHFARRTFAGRIEVRPPWEEASSHGGLVSIVINPGMAFGTGLHETTAGCLELLVEEVRPGTIVADIGCGSGILAVAAARLGAARVLATDVDPLAVEATRENARANEVSAIVEAELEPGEVGVPEWENDARPGLSASRMAADFEPARPNGASEGGLASRGPEAFDLVVANILAETLVGMRDTLAGAVRPGGTLVLSGIEAQRLKMVEEAFIGTGWTLARTVPKGDWVSISLHRDALAEPDKGPSVAPRPRGTGNA